MFRLEKYEMNCLFESVKLH
jgi:WD40 repeat protein